MVSNFIKRTYLLNFVEILRGHFNFDEAQERETREKVMQYFVSARNCELVLEGKLTANDLGNSVTALENLGDVYRFMAQNKSQEKSANSFLNGYIVKLAELDKATPKERGDLSEFLWKYRKSIPDIKPDVDEYGLSAA